MTTILLTWNPGQFNNEQWDPVRWDAEMVQQTRNRQAHPGNWSVGQRVKGIGPGDRVFLLRQGDHGRGLVARGQVTSDIQTGPHWREDVGGSASYVELVWLEALPLDQAIDPRELQKKIPDYKWANVFGSGRDVSKFESQLEKIWRDRVGRAGLSLLSPSDPVRVQDDTEVDEDEVDDELEALLDLNIAELETTVGEMNELEVAWAMHYFELFDDGEDDLSLEQGRERLLDGIVDIQDELAELMLPPENPEEVEEVVRGQGFGTAEENRRVELAAVATVTTTLRSKGYTVDSVESQKVGWDLTATLDGRELHVEVKGTAGQAPKFFLTGNEFRTSRKDPDWMLAVVTSALTNPRLRVFDKELFAEPNAILYAVDLSEHESLVEHPLA